ncbi:MAG: hypothetical protein QM599_04060 [Pseudoxanthomonas sp.]
MSHLNRLSVVAWLVLSLSANAHAGADIDTATDGTDACGRLRASPAMYSLFPGEFDFCLAKEHLENGRPEQARKLFQLAAGWGDKSAQTALGVAYFNGDGVPQDQALGLAWLQLAKERGSPLIEGLYRSALSYASDAEKARAQALFQQMRSTYADNVAAARAERHFQRQLRRMTSNNPVYGVGACIDGMNARGFAVPGPRGTYNGSVNAMENLESVKTCSLASQDRIVNTLTEHFEIYFDGWKGHVTTGPVEMVKPEKP